MIRVREHETGDAEDWEQLVTGCGGNALHLPPVHEMQYSRDQIHRWVVESDGQVVACALGCATDAKRLKGLLGKQRHLVLPTAPAVREEALVGTVRDALFRHARQSGFDRLQVQPLYSRWIVADEDLAAYRTTDVTEFVVDLRGGEDETLAAMHKNHRKSVRRAIRDGVEITEDRSVESLLRLRDLQLSSADRAEEKSEGFGVPDESFFRRLHERVYARGLGSVLWARHDGQTVAALAWLEGGDRAQTVRSGSLPEGYRNRAMYLLYWELMTRLMATGVVELNAGGVPSDAADRDHAQHGLYEFKNGFGGEPARRYGLDIPLDEVVR